MRPPASLRNRWVAVPGLIALATLAWNVHVARNANGLVEGIVVDAGGRPVAGATVILFERGFVTQVEKGRTTADAAGRFRFTDNRNHAIQIEAQTPVLGRSERIAVRLWFRSEDTRLAEPVRFAKHLP